MRMLSYARVCVEAQAGVGLPDVIEVDMLEDIRSVKVEYEWRPSYCPLCVAFGHRCQAETGQQPPVQQPPGIGISSPRQKETPAEDVWTEVSSRKRTSRQQQNATATPPPHSRELVPPARSRGAPQPPPSAHEEEYEVQPEEERQEPDVQLPANPDLDDPQFVASSIPFEEGLQELHEPVPVPDYPVAQPRGNRTAPHTNTRVLGLPSTSNPDVSRLGDTSCKPNSPTRVCSSVSEEAEISHDGVVNSQEQIIMCSISSDTTASPAQVRDTRSSKATSKANKTGSHRTASMSSNPPLPQHSSKSSKSRKK